MDLLTPSGSVSRRPLSSGKYQRSTTSSLSRPRSPEPVDNWSIFTKTGGGSSDSATPSVTVTAPRGPTLGPRGRPVRCRPGLSNLIPMEFERKSVLNPGPRAACLDLTKPETPVPNCSRYSRPYTRYNAVYCTSTGFKGITPANAITRNPSKSTGEQRPSAYHQKQHEGSCSEINGHKFDPPSVPCCGLHAKLNRDGYSHPGLSTFNSSNPPLLKLQEPGRCSSTALPARLMTSPWDYLGSAAGGGSDTETLVDPTPRSSSDSGMSLRSQQSRIQSPYTSGCVSLPSQLLSTRATGNSPNRQPPSQLVLRTGGATSRRTAINPYSAHGGSSSTSTKLNKPNINEPHPQTHTIGPRCDEIIATGQSFFSACLSWISPLFLCHC